MSDKLVTLNNLREFKAKCDTTYAKVGTGKFANATLERFLWHLINPFTFS